VIDLAGLIQRNFRLDGHPSAPPASTASPPLRLSMWHLVVSIRARGRRQRGRAFWWFLGERLPGWSLGKRKGL